MLFFIIILIGKSLEIESESIGNRNESLVKKLGVVVGFYLFEVASLLSRDS